MSIVSKQKKPARECGYYIPGICECMKNSGERCLNSPQYYVSVNGHVVAVCSLHKKRLEGSCVVRVIETERDVSDNPLYQHYYGDGRRMRGFDPNKREILN